MIPQNAEQLYSRSHAAYEAMIRAIGHERALTEYFTRHALPRSGMRILDAGCGTGAVTKALIAASKKLRVENIRYYGFDLTDAMLDRFKIGAGDRGDINLVQADVLNLPDALPADWPRFDLIVSAGMLEYVPKNKLADALSRLRGLLAPGGAAQIFISRPGPSGFLIKHLWRANLTTKEELAAAFSSSGFKKISITPFQRWGYAVTTA